MLRVQPCGAAVLPPLGRFMSRGSRRSVLVDISMPDEHRFSLIRKVRSRERDERVPYTLAIAVTAYASAHHWFDALAAGYDLHVSKPIHPQELADSVRRLAVSTRESRRIDESHGIAPIT